MRDECDLAVLGGGTAGYAAAFRASELGLKTVIVERDKLGGTCLHRGCIPTKSFLHAAALMEKFKQASRFGLHFSGAAVDWQEVVKAKDDVVEKIYDGLKGLARAHNVEIIAGTGRLGDENTLIIEGANGERTLSYKNLVLATGSRPKLPPGLTLKDDTVITSDRALFLREQPESIVILGGGYVGVEFASMWRSFGAEVAIVEMAPRLMMQEDAEISAALAKALEARGIKLYLGARFESVTQNGRLSVAVTTGAGETEWLSAGKLMAAVGREAVVDGLEAASVKITKGSVEVDGRLLTSRPNVYAVGDLLATPQLAHVAFVGKIPLAKIKIRQTYRCNPPQRNGQCHR